MIDYSTAERCIGELRPVLEDWLESSTLELIEAKIVEDVIARQAECKMLKKLLSLPEELRIEEEKEENGRGRDSGRASFRQLFSPRSRDRGEPVPTE